jgi:hypothetical protein
LRAVEPFVSWLILTRQTARPPRPHRCAPR